jgi:DNA repair protein RadC
MKINDLPRNERPREKAFTYGVSSLSNVELLSLIIGSGTKDDSALSLSHKLISDGNRYTPKSMLGEDAQTYGKKQQEWDMQYKSNSGNSLNFLERIDLHELTEIIGIGEAKAAAIASAVELGKRMASGQILRGAKIDTPPNVFTLLGPEMKSLNYEMAKVVMLNVRRELIGIETVSMGTITDTSIDPRRVFEAPLRKSAAAIILVHNHPSGNPNPSDNDYEVTKTLIEAGEILNIPLDDHIIIAGPFCLSIRQGGKVKWPDC